MFTLDRSTKSWWRTQSSIGYHFDFLWASYCWIFYEKYWWNWENASRINITYQKLSYGSAEKTWWVSCQKLFCRNLDMKYIKHYLVIFIILFLQIYFLSYAKINYYQKSQILFFHLKKLQKYINVSS